MRALSVLGISTFKELIREKFFLIVLLLAAGLSLFSLLLGNLSFDEKTKIVIDISFSIIQICSVFLGAFLGSFLIQKELEKQTLLLVLSRPVSRFQFIFGKVLGIYILLFLTILVLSFLPSILIFDFSFLPSSLLVGLSIWFEAAIIVLVAMLLSLLIRPSLAFTMSFSLMLLGHWIPDLKYFAEKSKDVFFIQMSQIIDKIVPQFYMFNWKSFIVVSEGIQSIQILWLLIHSISWMLIYSVILNRLFKRKDFV